MPLSLAPGSAAEIRSRTQSIGPEFEDFTALGVETGAHGQKRHRYPAIQERVDGLVLCDPVLVVIAGYLVRRIAIGIILVPARQQFHRYRAIGPRLVQEFVTNNDRANCGIV